MILWLVFVVICSAAAVALSVPLIRRYDQRVALPPETAVYSDQLIEVDRDVLAGNISAPEAQAAKNEIRRRLESATRSSHLAKPLTSATRNAALIGTAGFVILGSVFLYGALGTPNLPSAKPKTEAIPAAESMDAMILKLQGRLQFMPRDVGVWRLLGLANFSQQKWQESADAYDHAVALAPENGDLKSAEAEALVQGAGGTVTPKAQALIADALSKNQHDLRARYYDAVAHEQNGDPQGAYDRWATVLAEAPVGAPWQSDVRQRLATLAKTLGKPLVGGPENSGAPQSRSLAQAIDDQHAIIEGMVQKQADSLRVNPKDLDGWLRLMRSYVVLNTPDKAKIAWSDAKSDFAGDATALAKLMSAATELGLN